MLATKLYIPPRRPKVVLRPRLLARLNEGLHRKLTLISAGAGFGKTTLLGEWLAAPKGTQGRPDPLGAVAWLSLDAGDSDPARFLAYLVTALQTIAPQIGAGVLSVLQSPQPPPTETMLTALLNEITTLPANFVLVLDDYHLIEAEGALSAVDSALAFLLEHLPSQMHLVIATREDPQLPLARLRARDQLTELRATDLRFTATEAASFLNQVMGLNLAAAEIAALETRTEGWIAGLQLAALSMQGHKDAASFIKSFTGGHHFVMDYLIEEVLQQQSTSVQTFLLRTSILDRLCGPLCDAVLLDPAASGQATLTYIEHANLFIAPLDNERRWYRYHHLFAELLRQRLHQSTTTSIKDGVDELHRRASQWYEENGLALEAFQHAVAAHDIECAERLIDGKGLPLHFRGVVTSIIDWLASLPATVLNARPSLWWRYGSLLLVIGQTTGVAEKLQAAEDALEGTAAGDQTRNLVGQIAVARAVLALTRYQPETILAQSRRALEYLHPNNLALRANANWTLGYAYMLQGDRAAASKAYREAISISQASGDIYTTILATSGLGQVQATENQLHLAVETYRRVLQLAGDQPLQVISGAHLGLARILYEWNDLAAAEQHGQQSLHMARQYDRVIDRFVVCEVFLARLKLAQGDVDAAVELLAQTSQAARQQNFVHRFPEVAAAQVLTLLCQGNLAEAAHLAEIHALPLSLARVHLVRGDPAMALALLEPLCQQAEAKGWQDERLKLMVLQTVARHAQGEKNKAGQLLGAALALAEPGGFIRLFVDEGPPMAALLSEATQHGTAPTYVRQLLAAFGQAEGRTPVPQLLRAPRAVVIEPLSERELDVLRLLATELNGPEIARRLMVSLSTIRTHTKNVYSKLGVNNRRAAIRRAEELALF